MISSPMEYDLVGVAPMLRDSSTAEQARARIAAQFPLARKVATADHVIDNSGTPADTARQADAVLEAIRLRR